MSEPERSSIDDIIDVYKRDVDVSLIVERLRRASGRELMTDFDALLRSLSKAGVEFIVVGGVAAAMHGALRVAFNLDLVYRRTAENIDRLVVALKPYRPNMPGAPSRFPFSWNGATIQRGLNFVLTTAGGDVNLLGEIVGGGSYGALLPFTLVVPVFGAECRLLGLNRLIEVTRAAGRPQDFEMLAELETVRDLKRGVGAA